MQNLVITVMLLFNMTAFTQIVGLSGFEVFDVIDNDGVIVELTYE